MIPARGGSRGMAHKNVRRIGGKPMIAYTIEAALASRRIDQVVVSTDDAGIADVARRYGADAPFLRPAELARDDTPTPPAVEHAVRQVEAAGGQVDVVVTLQATSPFRDADAIDQAIELRERAAAESAVSVAGVDLPASIVGGLVDGRFLPLPLPPGTDLRRQAAPPAMRLTGAIYVTTRGLLATGVLFDERPVALVTAGAAALDVDDLADLRRARRIARSLRP
ncbi:MAG TPA: acylneuraminate cytidylyltransferase family protein [Candidatus Limnocylindria bacterium]|nr:acylneuraminate cytidylyltransferase family protein [Candidatus Limnocylindria bacterium]